MAIRNMVRIDEEKCNGCGLCIIHCAEGALRIVDGKARLVSESYCDGLGACLGECPQGAMSIEQREAGRFDEQSVKRQAAAAEVGQAFQPDAKDAKLGLESLTCGVSSSAGPVNVGCPGVQLPLLQSAPQSGPTPTLPPGAASPLSHWPVQLALVRADAAFLRGADLLLAADCAPLALADFHARLLRGQAVVIGCPKLDDRQAYVDKLRAIFQQAGIRSLTIIHMEVPCCGGLSYIARTALQASGRSLPVTEITVSIQGQIVAQLSWQ